MTLSPQPSTPRQPCMQPPPRLYSMYPSISNSSAPTPQVGALLWELSVATRGNTAIQAEIVRIEGLKNASRTGGRLNKSPPDPFLRPSRPHTNNGIFERERGEREARERQQVTSLFLQGVYPIVYPFNAECGLTKAYAHRGPQERLAHRRPPQQVIPPRPILATQSPPHQECHF